jgi:hypothetical protein
MTTQAGTPSIRSSTYQTGGLTSTLTNFQGGTSAAPVFLFSALPVGGVTGSIGGQGSEDYYSFNWGGGAFSATASITGANSLASYLFSAGVTGTCSSGGSATLNSGDNFTGTISIASLAPGTYCIGLNANNPNDPAYALTFNTALPAQTPEPSDFVLLSAGLGMISLLYLKKRRFWSGL